MVRSLVRRALSAVLMLLVSGGGGGLPVLDAALFHGFGPGPDEPRPHYEATSGCHTDRCTVRSLAYDLRCTPDLPTPPPVAVVSVVPLERRLPSASPRPAAPLPTLSRAPPVAA
jgi:hypothetical protein